jgi:membrane protein
MPVVSVGLGSVTVYEQSVRAPDQSTSRFQEKWDAAWARFEAWVYDYFGRGPIRRVQRAIFLSMLKHDGMQIASAMAFDLFLALIPLLALAGWTVSTVVRGDAQTLHNLSLLFNVTPADVQHVVNQHAERSFGGPAAPIALVGALWLGSGAFNTVMAAFEKTLPSAERTWWQRRILALACVFLLLASLCVGAWVSLQLAGGLVPLLRLIPEETGFDGAQGIGFLVSLLMTFLLIAGFFRIGVRRDVAVRHIWPGTLLTLAIAGLASYLFAEYARTLARYAFYYGSLAAVAVLLAWLWMCSMALLLGAELNVYLEEQTRNSVPPSAR